LVYVNPRPRTEFIDEAVKTGTHSCDANSKNVVTRRVAAKVRLYRDRFCSILKDVWSQNRGISWVDVGAGYGEVIEAVNSLASPDSIVVGLEPMAAKASAARLRNLNVQEKYLTEVECRYDFLSLINVFSHIPDFHDFLEDAKRVLTEKGEIILETGDTADLDRREIPGEIDLPDHLVFASQRHIESYLHKAGFDVVQVVRYREDTFRQFFKDCVKRAIGRNVNLRVPYTSRYRSIIVRARRK
jgi:ubiquinone/menaquinone biosynthesis C-methylase UbiE